MAMMLAMSRNIPIANETMHKGEWNRKKYVGVELRGKTLGVIGMGRIVPAWPSARWPLI